MNALSEQLKVWVKLDGKELGTRVQARDQLASLPLHGVREPVGEERGRHRGGRLHRS